MFLLDTRACHAPPPGLFHIDPQQFLLSMNFNSITNPVFKDSFNINTFVGQQQHGEATDTNIDKNQSKKSNEESRPALVSTEAKKVQYPGKENADEVLDRGVKILGVSENEEARVTRQDSRKASNTPCVVPNQETNSVQKKPSELVNSCNNVSTDYSQEISQIRDWCETALQEIHTSKETLEETKMELALVLCGCLESFDPNVYSEVEKMHAELRLLAEASPYLVE